MQRKAKSKAEKEWARRQADKIKERLATSWWQELEEKAKQSEIGKTTGDWDKTAARRDFDRARRLQAEQEELRAAVKQRCKQEMERIGDLDKELQGLRQQAASSNAGQEVQVVQVAAAVREAEVSFEEGAGPMLGRKRNRELELYEQLTAAQAKWQAAEEKAAASEKRAQDAEAAAAAQAKQAAQEAQVIEAQVQVAE